MFREYSMPGLQINARSATKLLTKKIKGPAFNRDSTVYVIWTFQKFILNLFTKCVKNTCNKNSFVHPYKHICGGLITKSIRIQKRFLAEQ